MTDYMKTNKLNVSSSTRQAIRRALLLLPLALMAAVGAQAQYEERDFNIQPRVGISLSTLTNAEDAKMKLNLTYGIDFEFFLGDNVSLTPGILFNNEGAKFEDNMTLNNYHFAIPVTASYYFLPGLAIKAGVQPAYRIKTTAKMDGTTVNLDNLLSALFEDNDVKLNKFDVSIPVGLSYSIAGVTLDARYNFGLTKIFSGIDESIRNNVIFVTLGIKL